MKLPKKPEFESPCQGVPNPMLKPHNTQTTSTTENATNVSIMLLIDQRFCITPPYSTARPGTLIKPTSVAAVICQEVSPGFSQLGASTGNGSPCPGRCGHECAYARFICCTTSRGRRSTTSGSRSRRS